jgi:hypothetical protein
MQIVAIAIHPDSGQIVWVATEGRTSRVGLIDSELNPVRSFDDSELELHRVVIPDANRQHLYVLGARGWIVLSAETFEVVRRINLGRQGATYGTVSADGRLVFGQRSETADVDTLFAYDAVTGEELGKFLIGDTGGGVHFTSAGGPDRVLLFVGDGSITQNAYVLSVPDLLLVQELGIPGLSWAVESADGLSIIAVQNRSLASEASDSGISLVVLRKDAAAGWEITERFELISGSGLSGNSIAAAPLLRRLYVPSTRTGQVFVVEE